MLPTVPPPILGVATSTTGLVGEAAQGPVEQAVLVTSLAEYEQVFGGPQHGQELFFAVSLFFLNRGWQASREGRHLQPLQPMRGPVERSSSASPPAHGRRP